MAWRQTADAGQSAPSAGHPCTSKQAADQHATSSTPQGQTTCTDNVRSCQAKATVNMDRDDEMIDWDSPARNYIAAGCLTISKSAAANAIPHKMWSTPEMKTWRWLRIEDHFRVFTAVPCLPDECRDALLSLRSLTLVRWLFLNKWILVSFRVSCNDDQRGILRVYVLPDNMNNVEVPRTDLGLQATRGKLLEDLDYSKRTWHGEAGDRVSGPVLAHTDPAGEEDASTSLLQIFNTLPPPRFSLQAVRDPCARYDMINIQLDTIPGIITRLYDHQKTSALAMLQREYQQQKIKDPRLSPAVDQDGATWYYDPINGTCRTEAEYYDGPAGGILAENMGCGKTLICLALIAATKDRNALPPELYRNLPPPPRPRVASLADMTAACITNNAVPWRSVFATGGPVEYRNCIAAIQRNTACYLPTSFLEQHERKKRGRDEAAKPMKVFLSIASVIIVPPNLLHQWEDEIRKHTKGLKVITVTAKDPIPALDDLLWSDIIIFTANRFEKMPRIQNTNRETILPGDLNSVHFKRCIIDEGHILGNSTTNTRSNLHLAASLLHVTARWVVTGTPSKGLYSVSDDTAADPNSLVPDRRSLDLERDDLKRLGSLAILFLKANPWETPTNWGDHILYANANSKNEVVAIHRKHCIKSTLETLIIRHVNVQQLLPPVEEKLVCLDGSYLDKLSMNLFSMMIIFNSVQSQREGPDYFFDPKQRKAVNEITTNLSQSSFFGGAFFSQAEIAKAVDTAERFLEEGKVEISVEDDTLIREAIRFGRLAEKDGLKRCAYGFGDIPVYVKNLPAGVGKEWSLNQKDSDPVLLTMQLLSCLERQFLRIADDALKVLSEDGGFQREGFKARLRSIEKEDPISGEQATTKRKETLSSATMSLAAHNSADPGKPDRASLATASLVSTASAKMSYLIEQVLRYHESERIVIFYEHETVAWYIQRALSAVSLPIPADLFSLGSLI